MKVKVSAHKYRNINGNWMRMYGMVFNALETLGADIQASKFLNFSYPPIVDEADAIYIYNHSNLDELDELQFFRGKKSLFLKPTAPTPEYFSIDDLGYASYSSITYKKPNFEMYESDFFHTKVAMFKENKEHKWSDREDLKMFSTNLSIPDNHVLVIGQMPGDETVTKQSFGNHWDKLKLIVRKLYKQHALVIKIHPTLQSESEKAGSWEQYKKTIDEWKSLGVTVIEGYESIHSVLPKTRVAIVENSTAGIECMMHDVPIISYGYPEYHWVTKDLRHLPQLTNAINDLSWWSKEKSRKFLSWYCEQYLCYDQESTTRRIKWLIESY